MTSTTTTETIALPSAGELPVLGRMREGIDPFLEWAPSPIRSAIWALVVFVLLLVALNLVVRIVLPWLGRLAPGPVDLVVNVIGMMLVLPEYVATMLLLRAERDVPNVMFEYGDAVQGVVAGTQRVSRSSLSTLTQLRKVSKGWLVVILLVTFAVWDGLYCSGRTTSCRMPTTEWTDSVAAWFEDESDS